MTDYISKEGAIDCVLSQYCASSDETEEALGDAIDAIKALPAADVVEVLRCKDCQYSGGNGFCEFWDMVVKTDDFCSYGWKA